MKICKLSDDCVDIFGMNGRIPPNMFIQNVARRTRRYKLTFLEGLDVFGLPGAMLYLK